MPGAVEEKAVNVNFVRFRQRPDTFRESGTLRAPCNTLGG